MYSHALMHACAHSYTISALLMRIIWNKTISNVIYIYIYIYPIPDIICKPRPHGDAKTITIYSTAYTQQQLGSTKEATKQATLL